MFCRLKTYVFTGGDDSDADFFSKSLESVLIQIKGEMRVMFQAMYWPAE